MYGFYILTYLRFTCMCVVWLCHVLFILFHMIFVWNGKGIRKAGSFYERCSEKHMEIVSAWNDWNGCLLGCCWRIVGNVNGGRSSI